MAVQNFTPSPTEVDLEATAELPAMDFAGTATDIASTDVHVAPGIPAGVAELAASLREAEQRLARKMERVAGLEGDLAAALRTAVELRAQLDVASAQAVPRESALREAELQLAQRTERVAALEAELANAQRTAVELRAQLDHESAQGARHEKSLREAEQQLARRTERVAVLETELANAQRTAVELRAQLDHESAQGARHEKSLREAEQQLARRTERVAALETELASEQRAVAEQRALLDQERLQGAQRERQLRERGLAFEQQLTELRQELAARDASNRRQAQDLLDLRRRNERSLEALQTWQGFRGVAVAQLDEQDAQLVQAGAQYAAQIAAAEARLAQLKSETDASIARLTAEAETRIAKLQSEAGSAAARLQSDAAARVAKLQSEAEARFATLKSETDERAAQLQSELAAARLVAENRVAALEESLRVALASNEAGTVALQAQQQLNQTLQAQLNVATTKAGKAEEDLHVAEEHIHRLESEAHASATLLGSLQQNVERLGRDDTGSRPVLRVVATEPAVRVLIRQVDGVDVVYPLGKRTTIGRTPDNDIQVDTTFISRHHAVLLSNPDQCVVEDLNSTNGVMVNGRPVNRQALRDGDLLTVGKSEFRYQQRA
jgi:chromosome segregation ATPase